MNVTDKEMHQELMSMKPLNLNFVEVSDKSRPATTSQKQRYFYSMLKKKIKGRNSKIGVVLKGHRAPLSRATGKKKMAPKKRATKVKKHLASKKRATKVKKNLASKKRATKVKKHLAPKKRATKVKKHLAPKKRATKSKKHLASKKGATKSKKHLASKKGATKSKKHLASKKRAAKLEKHIIHHSCKHLSGVAAMQCLAFNAANSIRGITHHTSLAIVKEAAGLSSKIKKSTEIAANRINKHDFALSFIQLHNQIQDCSTFIGIAKLYCLTAVATNKVEHTGNVAAIRINKVAQDTAKQVNHLTAIVKTISGFEGLVAKMQARTNGIVKQADGMATRVKKSGQKAALKIDKAAGNNNKKISLLEVASILNDEKISASSVCKGFTGVTHMKCVAKKAAEKMRQTGNVAAKTFMREASNLASKIDAAGAVASHDIVTGSQFTSFVEMHKILLALGGFPGKDKLMVGINSQVDTNSGVDIASLSEEAVIKSNCDKLVGVLKLQCIAQDASHTITITGKNAANRINAVASASALTVIKVAAKVKKISGFEDISSKMGIAAGVLKLRGSKLATRVAKAGTIAANDISHSLGLK